MSKVLLVKGLSNEEIVERLQECSNHVVELMANKQKDDSIRHEKFIVDLIIDIKEHVSQTNDIRSPHYDSNRQFIMQLNDIIVEMEEKQLQAFRQWGE